jgi:GNAT superfamily N-acetyltransferase
MRRSSPVEIASFRPEDQAVVRQLILDGLEEHWGSLDPGLNPDLDDIRATYGHGTVLVARIDGRVVGVGMMVPAANDEGEVKRMSVARDRRRTGVATALLAELVAVARAIGWRALVLETTAAWSDAVQFYEQFGFTLTHHEQGTFGRDAYFRMDF